MLLFQITGKDGDARSGKLVTGHGTIETPSFVPVGTLGAVRALSADDLGRIGTQIIIANTYHLHLQPGEDIIRRMGGLHRFMAWKGPLMTDSGGFQIFSLGAAKEQGVGKIAPIFPDEKNNVKDVKARKRKPLVRIDESGAEFTSYLDGSSHRFTPERVIEIQRALGADIILALDECTSPLHDHAYTRASMERTHRWSVRALNEYNRHPPNGQALFGIVQGGAFRDLREESAAFISNQNFDGYAIGGSLGRSKDDMHQVLEWTLPLLPETRPRHLLGIGTVADIFEVVKRGIDLFDCVAPTRMARTGTLFVKEAEGFKFHILNAAYRNDSKPVERGCQCYTCSRFSRAYLRHLFAAREPLATHLAAIHNLHFVEALMCRIRIAIKEKRFDAFRREWGGRRK